MRAFGWFLAVVLTTVGTTRAAVAAQDEPPSEQVRKESDKAVPPKKTPAPLEVPREWLRLDPKHEVWLDPKGKRVIVGGQVCLREGQLEMFACPKGTKEHESVVAINGPAHIVHAGLLALGAKEGKPVQFQPEYQPASGVVVDVQCVWLDPSGTRQTLPAQKWVKRVKTGKALEYDWVFAGSGFWNDGDQRYYYGDAGEFICVSNFPTATLDLPVESTQANEELLFAPFTENIPPRGTAVHLMLTPRLAEPKSAAPAGLTEKTEKEETADPASNQADKAKGEGG